MASSSAVSAVRGSQGGVLRGAGRGDRVGRRYGRGVRFELHGGVFLVWSCRPVGRLAAGTGSCCPEAPSLVVPVRGKQKGRGSRVGFRGPEGAGLIAIRLDHSRVRAHGRPTSCGAASSASWHPAPAAPQRHRPCACAFATAASGALVGRSLRSRTGRPARDTADAGRTAEMPDTPVPRMSRSRAGRRRRPSDRSFSGAVELC